MTGTRKLTANGKEATFGDMTGEQVAAWLAASPKCQHDPPQPATCDDCWLDAPPTAEEQAAIDAAVNDEGCVPWE